MVVPPPAPAPTGVFPVAGPYTFGDPFGVDRPGHVHQGQDIAAASGTPVVAPLAGTVLTAAYQASGAGYYVVLHGDDGRDYVFMHLQPARPRWPRARPRPRVSGSGSSARPATPPVPHLHFEIWLGRLVGVDDVARRSTRCPAAGLGRPRVSGPSAASAAGLGQRLVEVAALGRLHA